MINPINIKKLELIDKNKPDDVFILCASYEERCLGFINMITNNYKVNEVLLIRYDHPNHKRENNIKIIKRKLKNKSKVLEFIVSENMPLPIINEIIQLLINKKREKKNLSINFDFSTMIKWHFLLFLKALEISGLINEIRYLYTEPKDYIVDLFQPLSFGIKTIFPIPFYSGDYNFSKNTLLVLILGYEDNRASALLEEMDPAECLLLIPKPAYHKEWEGRTEKMNKGIIKMVGESNVSYLDSRNPIKVKNQLKTILKDEKYQNYNHIISPLGTKPQTLGLYLYLREDPTNTVVIYGAPLRHNNLFYSEGIGRSWIIPIKEENN